jgi:hypothetical protein
MESDILFFHHFEDGEIQHQGYIVELDATGKGLACLFSWATGQENGVYPINKEWIVNCVFYRTTKEMNDAAVKAGK